jgi:hypothetical protein
LVGMTTALNRFISKLSKHGMSFYKLLRKADDFQWDDQAVAAFFLTRAIFDVCADLGSTVA